MSDKTDATRQQTIFDLKTQLGITDRPARETIYLDPNEILVDVGPGEDLEADARHISVSIDLLNRMQDPVVLRERVQDDEGWHTTYRAIAGRTRIIDARMRGEPDIEVHCYQGLDRAIQRIMTLAENHSRRVPWKQTIAEIAALMVEDHWSEERVRDTLAKTCTISRQQMDRYLNIARLPASLYQYVMSGKLTQTIANTVASPRFDAERRATLATMAANGQEIDSTVLRALYTAQVAPALLDALTDTDDAPEAPVVAGSFREQFAALDTLIAQRHPNSKARMLLTMALRALESETEL